MYKLDNTTWYHMDSYNGFNRKQAMEPCNEPSCSIGLALNLASLQNYCLIVHEFCCNSCYIVISLLCGLPCGNSGHESIQIPCHKHCTEVFFPVCNIWMHIMVFRYPYIMLNIHIHKIC